MLRRSISTSPVPIFVHSTFRDAQGRVLRPGGLQWGLPGTSHVRFVIMDGEDAANDSPNLRCRIVQSYNRWCFAKDLKFQATQNICSIVRQGPRHIQVEWKDTTPPVEKVTKHEDIDTLLRQDPAATKDGPPAQVWMNGEYIDTLDGSSNIDSIVEEIPVTDNKLCLKRADGVIRIDRYYHGFLREKQAWDHIWDNLVALEDPEILDEDTLIGTATLRDWVRGGHLTSRLWVRDSGDSILFLRPLRNDDISTSDRRYELSMENEERVNRVRAELERLRYLATLHHPFAESLEDSETSPHDERMTEARKRLQQNRKRGKKFVL